MKTLIDLIFSIFLIASVIATSHPFVGEYENASSLTRPDGTLTMRLQEKITSFSKYDNLIDRSFDFETDMTFAEQAIETIFGKSEKK